MKKIIAMILKVLLAVVVLIFLGTESIGFFSFVFPPEKWYMAYTGFGLTSLSFLIYLYLFIYDADTDMKRVIALIMMAVGLVGELVTAGFGMQVEAWSQMGYVMTESDIDFMVLAIQALMLFHGIALIGYWIGDSIVKAFKDDDGDGIPNIFDSSPRGIAKNAKQTPVVDFDKIEMQRTIKDLEKRLAEATQKPAQPAFASQTTEEKPSGNPHTGQGAKE